MTVRVSLVTAALFAALSVALRAQVASAATLVVPSQISVLPGASISTGASQFFGHSSGVYYMTWTHSGSFTIQSFFVGWKPNGTLAASYAAQTPTFLPAPMTDCVIGGWVPYNTPPGASACIDLKVWNILGQQVASAQMCVNVPVPQDSCHVPWDQPFAQADTSIDVVMTIHNGSNQTHQYLLAFQPTPGVGGMPGAACNVTGPTTFTVQGPNPVPVGPGQTTPVTVTVDRPVGLTAANLVACYEVLITNLTFGTSITCHGSVQDARDISPGVGMPKGRLPLGIIPFPVGTSEEFFFTLENTGEDPSIGLQVPFEIRAFNPIMEPDAAVSLNNQPPTEPVCGFVDLPVGVEIEIPLNIYMGQLQTPGFTDLVLYTDANLDGVFVPMISFAVGATVSSVADLDGDGIVGFSDLLIVLSAWGAPNPEVDFDGSGIVDFADLLFLLAAWGLDE